MSYPPPAPPASQQQPRLRGRTPLRVGIVLLVLGIAAIVVGAVIAVNTGLSKVDEFPRVAVPTTASVNSTTAYLSGGGYVAYLEGSGISDTRVPLIPVRVTSPSGHAQVLDTPYGGTRNGTEITRLTYDYHGHHGIALWQFNVGGAGNYKIEVQGGPNVPGGWYIAVGRSLAKSTAAGAATIIGGVLLFIAGLILLIVGLVKRSRSKKELAAAGAYGGAPGYPSGYPQGAYPRPGYPQQAYQPAYPQQGPPPSYPQGGYQQAGYPQPGYQQAGYQQPGYPQPGYQQPGGQQEGNEEGSRQPGYRQEGNEQQGRQQASESSHEDPPPPPGYQPPPGDQPPPADGS